MRCEIEQLLLQGIVNLNRKQSQFSSKQIFDNFENILHKSLPYLFIKIYFSKMDF